MSYSIQRLAQCPCQSTALSSKLIDVYYSSCDFPRFGDPDIGLSLNVLHCLLELHSAVRTAEHVAMCRDVKYSPLLRVLLVPILYYASEAVEILLGSVAVTDIHGHIVDLHGKGHDSDITLGGFLEVWRIPVHIIAIPFEAVLCQDLRGLEATGGARAGPAEGSFAGDVHNHLLTFLDIAALGLLVKIHGQDVLSIGVSDDLMALSDEEWGSKVLASDPLFERVSDGERLALINKAMRCAEEEFDKLVTALGARKPSEYAEALGIRVKEDYGVVRFPFLYFGMYNGSPPTINVAVRAIVAVGTLIEESSSLSCILPVVDMRELVIAHELFHHIEEQNNGIFTRSKNAQVNTLFGLVRYQTTSRGLGEIASKHFCKVMMGLPFSPTIYEPILVHADRLARKNERRSSQGGGLLKAQRKLVDRMVGVQGNT